MPGVKRNSSAMSDAGHTSSLHKSVSKFKSSTAGSSRAPSLRRAPTLPLPEAIADVNEGSSENGELDGIVTTVKRLRSGSSVGCTAIDGAMTLPASSSKKLSVTKKESLIKSLTESGQVLNEIDEAEMESDVTPSVTPPLPPGGLMEIVFSFDTTGSMSGALGEVRGRLKDLIQRLQADIPGMRISIFAHGDYCDKDIYVTKWIDFGSSMPELCDFVSKVKPTSGGDSDECYELVLRQVREELSWTPGSQRALVMIGDSNPHEPNYYDNVLKINWRDEVTVLNDMAVKIYGIECDAGSNTSFYQQISDGTGGLKLKLAQFSNIFDIIMAICYREGGANLITNYEAEVRKREGGKALNKDLEGLFGVLRYVPPVAPLLLPATTLDKTVSKSKPVNKRAAKAAVKSSAKRNKKLPGTSTKKKIGKGTKLMTPTGRRLREVVSKSDFLSNSKLRWSRWNAVIMPCKARNRFWEVSRGNTGSRIRAVFGGQLGVPAVYELAVQPAPGVKRYVVYFKAVTGRQPVINWQKYLLSDRSVKREINYAVSLGGQIRMRRAVMNKRTKPDRHKQLLEVKGDLMAKYDYAWIRYPPKRKCHRQQIRSKFMISHSDF